MTECLAITRQGFGHVLRFESPREAWRHPCVQYGDAVLQEPLDLVEQYTALEWGGLLRLAGLVDEQAVETLPHLSEFEKRSLRKRMVEKIWARLQGKAIPPPMDGPGILAMVAEDRRRDEKIMAAVGSAEKTTRTGDLDPKAKIYFGEDKDGNKYSGSKNNPYREGSNRATRFAALTNGVTVGKILEGDSGYSVTVLKREQEAGFITITDPA